MIFGSILDRITPWLGALFFALFSVAIAENKISHQLGVFDWVHRLRGNCKPKTFYANFFWGHLARSLSAIKRKQRGPGSKPALHCRQGGVGQCIKPPSTCPSTSPQKGQ